MKLEYYTATWCSPCKVMLPLIEEVADKQGHELKSINVEHDPKKAMEREIRLIPQAILINEEDEVIQRLIGVHEKAEVTKKFKL